MNTPMSNDEMQEKLRPIEKINYELVRLIEFAIFSGVGQSYTVEYKKEMLQRVLDKVEFKQK